jgi:hypothetical protein
MTKKAIGAYIKVCYNDENNRIANYYASLGKFNCKKNTDTYGVPDYEIFHYFEDGLKELKQSKGKKITYDINCTLLDYELKYKNK